MRLDGKVALITGGGSGIGAATARLMAERGAAVTLAGIPAAGIEAVAAEIGAAGGRCLAVTTDVTVESDIEAAVQRTVESFGKLDAVVANAGVQRHNTDIDLFEMDLAEWERTQDVNLRGVVRACKHGLAQMIRQGGGGAIVIVSSVTALQGRTPNVSYMTAKTGLLGLNRHIAVHYARHGIRSNAVCPGALQQTPDWDQHPDPEGRKATMEAAIPLGRLGSSEDIAPWIAFLASDAASYATGGFHVVDGGMTIA
ncbi:MAG: SDR family NAD(P)-dependent oxidoreductase [Alphaproteobacteria bacterium]|jgi:NAD(P)-dependent dehydrogenase (short-subunit alcohol dehydrogenase family)|nr:SDR family NAD(P)-dependent oxidoreductase [Alphaproteobacteria bacterium]